MPNAPDAVEHCTELRGGLRRVPGIVRQLGREQAKGKGNGKTAAKERVATWKRRGPALNIAEIAGHGHLVVRGLVETRANEANLTAEEQLGAT